MILPIPEATGMEDAVEFVNMEDYDKFFEDLYQMFHPPTEGLIKSRSLGLELDLLQVVEVGSFVASFVPTQKDFIRLDPRFRLDPEIWAQLPQYNLSGFVVFQFKAGANKPHPMAFKFKTSTPGRLFFPTIHVHDGMLHKKEKFDHVLYFQSTEEHSEFQSLRMRFGTYGDFRFLQKYIDLGVMSEAPVLCRKEMKGLHANEDVLVKV